MTPATEPTEQDITAAVAQWRLQRRFGLKAKLPAYAADEARKQAVETLLPSECVAEFKAIKDSLHFGRLP